MNSFYRQKITLTMLLCFACSWAFSQQDSLYTADNIPYFIIKEGNGEKAKMGQETEFHIVVTSVDGMQLFSTKAMGVTNFAILGKDEDPAAKVQDNAFLEMRPGGTYKFFIPKSKLSNPAVAQLPGNHVIYTIDLIETGEPKPSAVAYLRDIIAAEGVEAAALEYKGLQSDNPLGYVFRESEINIQGYEYLEAGKIEAAIAMFKINVDQFPESFNALDSLGDGYLANDDKENAKRCFTKSLKLNPDSEYTKQKLADLE